MDFYGFLNIFVIFKDFDGFLRFFGGFSKIFEFWVVLGRIGGRFGNLVPSTWKVQPRKRENHCSVPAAPQNSQQQNVDFVVFVAALFLWSSFPWSLHASPCIHASMHPCIHASIHPSIFTTTKCSFGRFRGCTFHGEGAIW